MKKLLALLLLLPSVAFAQSQQVWQPGHVTPGHAPRWITNGVIGDGGTPGNGLLSGLGVTYNGSGICQNSAAITGSYNQLCLGTTTTGGGYLSFFNHAGGTGNLFFNVNGTIYPFPFTGTGTVTNITAGANITLTPNPCTTTCTIAATGSGPGGGTVTNVSGTNSNGFTVNVTNQSTTPNITVGTGINGYLLGNGTSVSAGSTTGSGSLVLATGPSIVGESVSGIANFTGTFQKSGQTMTFPVGPATLSFLVGPATGGHCVQFSGSAGGVADAGAVCGSGGPGGSTANRQDFVAPGGFTPGSTSSLTLASAPVTANAVTVTFDGVTQAGNTWCLAGSVVSFGTGANCSTPTAIPLNVAVVDVTWLSASVSLGTVQSVAFQDFSSTPIFNYNPAGSTNPVTSTGILGIQLLTQSANTFFAGPNTGSAAQPSFRAMVPADLPLATSSLVGGVKTDGSTITVSGAGQISCTTGTSSQLGCLKPDGTIITVSSGAITVPKATNAVFGVVEVDNTTITASGGVISAVGSSLTVGSPISGVCTSGYVVYSNGGNVGCENLAGGGNVSNSGTPTIGQLAIWTNSTTIQGVTALPSGNMPTFTGDVTNSGLAMTVGKIGGNAVSLGGALTFSGAFATTITVTAGTSVTLPTSGTLVNTGVTSLSSLATVGTIGTGTWQGSVVGATYGGTGVNNGSNTLTLGGALTTTGAATPTLAFGTGSYTYTFSASGNDTIGLLAKKAQAYSGGVEITSYSIGTLTSGTTTIDCGNGAQQYFTNNATSSLTIAAPSSDSNCLILMTNNSSGTLVVPTFSGFTSESSHGDTITITNNSKFTISVWKINGTADYRVVAMQ